MNGADPTGLCDPRTDPECISDPETADIAPELPTTETTPDDDGVVVTALRIRSEEAQEGDVAPSDELPIVVIGDTVRRLVRGPDYEISRRTCTHGNNTTHQTVTTFSAGAYAGARIGGHLHRPPDDIGPRGDDGSSVSQGRVQYAAWGHGSSFGAGKIEFRAGHGFTYRGLGGPQPSDAEVRGVLAAFNRGGGRGSRAPRTRCRPGHN